MTGNDRIKTRFLYEKHFEYDAKFKPIMCTNHRPIISGTDLGIWRRLALIPFNVTIPPEKQDKSILVHKFKHEWPGILNWMIKGCEIWQRYGLIKPPEVKIATAAYKTESDILFEWLEDRTETGPKCNEYSKTLYENYTRFCADSGDPAISTTMFGKRMAEKGFIKERSTKARYWKGIKLKEIDENVEENGKLF